VPASNPSSDLEYEHGIEKADVLKSYYLTTIKSTKRNKNGVKNRTGQNNQVTVKLFVFDKLQKNRTIVFKAIRRPKAPDSLFTF
jgi:hypothetical protein